jgi:hypothetical protein
MLLHSPTVAPPEAVQVIELKFILLEIVVGFDVQVFWANAFGEPKRTRTARNPNILYLNPILINRY